MAVPRQLEIWPGPKRLSFQQRKELIRDRLIGLEYRQADRNGRRAERNARRYAAKDSRVKSLRVGPRQVTIFGLTDPAPPSPRANRELKERKGGFSRS